MQYLLHHFVEAAAATRPNDIAVIDGGRSITYERLEASANQLARLIMELGVQRGDRVGLYLEKSIESIVGIYGILKAGAAYVPLDPQAPPARLAYIAQNCGIHCLLSGTEKASRWVDLLSNGAPIESIVVLNAESLESDAPGGIRVLTASDLATHDDSPPSRPTIALDLAYILYTSGSTGQPKGVKLTHQNGIAFVDWAVDTFGVRPEDRLSSHAPLHFDLSVFDLFAAARVGATVVLVPRSVSVLPVEIARFIEEKRISVWYSVPSVLTMLATRGALTKGSLSTLKTILFAGEVFPTKYLRRLMQLLPHVRFANLYGPTETNVCTFYEVPQLPEDMVEPIPIGKPIAGVDAFAVTDEGRIARRGEVGELYVRGPTVMQGYWGDPERSGQTLFPNPFGGELSDNTYRTGDMVLEQEDGAFKFLGRRDAQIKSRGYRIELGEIETALYAHPGVVECAVTAVPDELVTNRIKAFVVVREGVTESDLVRFCADRIPRYMIPETLELRPNLPKTSTGKVDRQALAGVGAGP